MIYKIFVFCLLYSLLICVVQVCILYGRRTLTEKEMAKIDRAVRIYEEDADGKLALQTIPTRRTVATIPTTTKRPVPPMARAFVVCVKFKGAQGKILHDSDRKTPLAVTGYTETVSLCRKTVVFRTFLVNSPNFYQLQGKCLAEYGQDFYTVEVILGKEEPKNLDAKFWMPVRIKSGGVFGRAHFKISNNGRDEMAAVDRSHWTVEQAFYRPPYCGITGLPARSVMDTYGPSESGTIPQGFRSLNFDVGTLSCKSGGAKVDGQRGRPKVYGYVEFYDYCNEAYSFCAFHMPEKAFEAFDGFCPKLTTFTGTTVTFKHNNRDYHCLLRQFSNVFYPTQLDDYEYKLFMNFGERFQEDEIYRKIGCPLS